MVNPARVQGMFCPLSSLTMFFLNDCPNPHVTLVAKPLEPMDVLAPGRSRCHEFLFLIRCVMSLIIAPKWMGTPLVIKKIGLNCDVHHG